jgi:hypothetical protein
MPFQAKPMRGVRRRNEHLPFRPITSVTWIPTFRADIFRVQSFPSSTKTKNLSVFQEGVLMGQKLSATLIVIGGLLMALGLTLLAAGFAQKQDESIAGAGICAFAFGALSCASGMYLKARAIQAAVPVNPNTKAPTKQRGGCDLCGTESPAVMCRVHQVHLCPACLAKHYDTRSCVYVPSTRRPMAAKAARA